MELWKPVLIVLGSLVAGLLMGTLVYKLISRRKSASQEARRTVSVRDQVELAASGKMRNGENGMSSGVREMAPLLSRRSITILSVGLSIGVVLGLVYWMISPSLANVSGTVRATTVTTSDKGPFECRIVIQIMNRGATYQSLKDLQYQGEYYTARMRTFPFLQYLSQRLAEQSPPRILSQEDLAAALRFKYSYESDSPGAIEVKATSMLQSDASFLADFAARALQDYLISDEHDAVSAEMAKNLSEMQDVKASLLEAEREMSDLALKAYPNDVAQNAEYVGLQAQVAALENEVNTRAAVLAKMVAEGVSGGEYEIARAALDKASEALGTARREMARLEVETSANYFEQTHAYQAADERVADLRGQLEDLTSKQESLVAQSDQRVAMLSYLVVGKPSSPVAIPPERIRARNALMIGGVLGIGIAWLLMNRRWLIKRLSSTGELQKEEA